MNMTNTKKFTRMTLLVALLAILAFTPLGFIMIPPISITIMHIPVIVGSIILGPVCGGILGFCFGLFSMIKAICVPTAGDIIFSPMLSGAPLASIVMCLIPRIILGIVPGLLYIAFTKIRMPRAASIVVSAGVSTALHTMLVLLCMVLFFKEVAGMAIVDVFKYLIGINGVVELLAAIVVSGAVCTPLLRISSKDKQA